MVRQGASNQRHYTSIQKANTIAKVQAYLVHSGLGCSVLEARQKCVVNCINFIKWKNATVTIEKQLKKKRTNKSTHDCTLLLLLSPITVELLHFF